MGAVENLKKMLAEGRDSALLRYGLGDAYFKLGDFDAAVSHLESAVQQDPGYSAAWKLLGKSLDEAGRAADAREAFAKGISAAEGKGDIQAAKEMKVFLKRIEKNFD